MSQVYNRPLVLVTVGGDHHPFERLMRWVENLEITDGERLRCVVQHGSCEAPVGVESHDYLDHSELMSLMSSARVVVSSGGPSTLLEARRFGHRPVVVPRWSSLGEHVDDHQRLFTSRLQEAGVVVRVETEADFRAAVLAALDAPRLVLEPADLDNAPAVARVGAIIDGTVREVSERRSKFLVRTRARSMAGTSARG
jgi:UDP-N-acetylglucosamine transferase subunit ALG13